MTIAGVFLLFSLFIPSPISQPISDSGILTGNSQAPWFFLWVQQLLKLGDPFVFGVLTPVLVIVVLGLLPYVLPNAKVRSWVIGSRPKSVAQMLAAFIILIILVLTFLGSISG